MHVKINYTKDCIKHKAVKKVKKILLEAYSTMSSEYDIWATFNLTGVSEYDNLEVKHYLDGQMKTLRLQIGQDIKDEYEFSHGYNLNGHMQRLQFIQKLATVCSIIVSEYPK